jgi:hypothetical protein
MGTVILMEMDLEVMWHQGSAAMQVFQLWMMVEMEALKTHANRLKLCAAVRAFPSFSRLYRLVRCFWSVFDVMDPWEGGTTAWYGHLAILLLVRPT